MPTFEYEAQNADGTTVNGMAFATSLDGAARDLARQGLQVMNIRVAQVLGDPLAGSNPPMIHSAVPAPPVSSGIPASAEIPSAPAPYVYDVANPVETPHQREQLIQQRSYVATSVVGPIVGTVNLNDLLFFFRQFATMLHAGVPMAQSLNTLAKQSRDPRLGRVVSELVQHVEAGRPISAGLQRYPEIFTPIMLSLVRAGEEGGMLDHSLSVIADYIERDIALRTLYRRVTFMPKLQLIFSVIIVLGTNLIIASLGKKGGLTSPLTEPTTWIWLGPLVVGTFLFFRLGLANSAIKYNWDAVVSYVPYVGNTFRQLSMARFGRAFGALYRGGVPLQRCFLLSADACGNEYLRARMYSAAKKLESGEGIAHVFRETGAFTDIVLDMVATGEQTGSLDQMFTKVADYYEDEGDTRSRELGQVVGILVGLCVAAYIGYIVINFYMGYFGNMNQAVNG